MKQNKNLEKIKPLLDANFGEQFEFLDLQKDGFQIVNVVKKGKYKDSIILFDGKWYYLTRKANEGQILVGKSKSLKKLIPESVVNLL